MTKEVYSKKRGELIAKAKAFIDEGNKGVDYKAVLTKIDNLDSTYDAVNIARANFEAMYGNRPHNMRDVFAAASIYIGLTHDPPPPKKALSNVAILQNIIVISDTIGPNDIIMVCYGNIFRRFVRKRAKSPSAPFEVLTVNSLCRLPVLTR